MASGSAEGVLDSLWRYPVKSMQGEELGSSQVALQGLAGDRRYALVDVADLKVASAKDQRRWPGLFAYRAAYLRPPTDDDAVPGVRITLPSGQEVTSEEPLMNEVLSRETGRRVRLDRRERPYFDEATLHLLTTATLGRLRELYPQGNFEARRFRPNLLLRTDTEAGFAENGWVGRTIRIGDQVRLEITGLCARCVMTTLPQGDLKSDPGVLRTAAEHNRASVGVYARVMRPGRVACGDSFELEPMPVAPG